MKLHYTKILLFSLPLNILAHNKNKPYITPNIPTTTSRVLSECDIHTSIYDNDKDMKSVKENFHRQTEQRFHEYDKRMIKNRQKRKEKCDKEIQKIILKDKMEKSFAEKLEKCCLRCGCGLGGVAASVGIIGAIAVNEVKKAAFVAAAQKGIDAGIKVAIDKLGNIVGLSEYNLFDWTAMVTSTTYNQRMELVGIVSKVYNDCTDVQAAKTTLFCMATKAMGNEPKVIPIQVISEQAADAAVAAGEAAKAAKEADITLANTASYSSYIAIAYSVIAILIILLIMIIIYLILRYRRKKKMNKKSQYTKLLNQ
ncbi:rifin [Plasmodium falciparum IGH-CR14]|uniref:Rifin n=1 Tax=Plasmodium falciparum IGH-CR14 TaxID=580059 RepID=A0A0L1I3L1_PLAFA|nr:rifin [Plasmodium falciparum IGH-CR14]